MHSLAVGLALGSVGDVFSLYWSATGHSGSALFDTLWPLSVVLLGFAAWQPTRPVGVLVLQGRRLLAFPLAFVLVALGLLSMQSVSPLHAGGYLLALATVVGAAGRMALTFAENLRLVQRSRHEALTDLLTGLGNRRGLLLALDDALQSASTRAPWGLLLFDLNGFKLYNDAFGHPAGDALLARLGAKLAAAEAPAGNAYRLGGDEFCVLARIAAPVLVRCPKRRNLPLFWHDHARSTHARWRGGDALARLADGPWPPASIVTARFGRWPAARAAVNELAALPTPARARRFTRDASRLPLPPRLTPS